MTYWTQKYEERNPLTLLGRELNDIFEAESAWTPACDVTEEEGHYLLTLDMPGIPRDDIKIETRENTMTITGERRNAEDRREQGSWYGERRYGKFQRSFRLPAGVDAAKIEASYQDGVLRIAVPKAEAAKPRQIKISSDGGFFSKLLSGERSAKPERAENSVA